MIRCIAVDDEALALDLLEDNIRQVPFLHLVSRCQNAIQAAQIIQTEAIELVFLDVQMPGLTGLQLVQTLPQPPMVILITAYDKYALEGFNLNVVDYLLKPVSFDRFLKACHKAQHLYQLENRPAVSPAEPDYLFVHVDYNLVKVVRADVRYIEGLKDYVKIHLLSSTKPVVTRMTLKSLEEKLPANRFLRVHKSFIVAFDKITAIKRDWLGVGDAELPMSDYYKENLARLLGHSGR
jgi:DNA-binding LytR/AlgR family response regulator